jgi:hypothetical protein
VFAGTVTAQAQDKPAKEPTQADYEKLLKEQIDMVKQMVDILESAKDKASGNKALPRLKTLTKKNAEIRTRMKKLGEPNKEIETALKKKFEPEMLKVVPRMIKEVNRIGQDPELKKVMEELQKFMEAMQGRPPARDKPAEKDKPSDK